MPHTIEVVVSMTVSEEDYDVNRLEARVRGVRDQTGRALFVRALERLDEMAREAHPGAVRQRRVERRLDTTLGPVVFSRWRVQSAGHANCLLDRLLGLPRSSRVSPAVKKRGCELAARMTYREAARVLSEELGTPLRAASVHRWVQEVGAVVQAQELAADVGSSSSGPSAAGRELVVAEIDDTPVRSQQPGEEKLFLKLGIAYSQKRRVGTQKRWELSDKLVYGGVESAEEFGERFYGRVEQEFAVERARHVLVKGDGAEWIHQLAEHIFPGHVFQLDRWHLLDRLATLLGHEPRLWKRLRRWVYQGRVGALVQALRQWVGADARSEQARQELLGYITRHREAITAVDRLRPRVSAAARPLLTHGTGAMEKNVEVWIGRRFKRWGMRWTRAGAQHLLKLRLWIHRRGANWFEALHHGQTQLTNA